MSRRDGARISIIIACLLVSLSPLPAAAQDVPLSWQPLGAPAGAITQLAASADGDELFSVSVAGTTRQPDQTQWRETGTPARSDALYGSDDGGAHWQPLTNDLPPGPIGDVYMDPASGELWAGVMAIGDTFTQRLGLWHSPDRGMSWSRVRLGRDDVIVHRITRNADASYLLLGATVGEKYASSYVYRSADGGRTWSSFEALRHEQRPGSTLTGLTAHPTDAGRLFLTTFGGDLFLSEDAGQSWRLGGRPGVTPDPMSGPAQVAVSSDQPEAVLLVRGVAGTLVVERSADRGRSWSLLNAKGLPTGSATLAMAALPGGVVLLGTTAGTYRSTDGGRSWQLLEGALSSGGVAELLFVPAAAGANAQSGVVLAATGQGVFASRDGGAIWQLLGAGLPFNSRIAGLLTHPARPQLVFALSDGHMQWGAASPPLILRSLDGGLRWSPAAQGLPETGATAWAIDPNDPDVLFIASPQQIFRSNDGGLSWQNAQVPSGWRGTFAIAPSDSKIIYAGGRPALRSTDGGATWQEMPVVVAGQERQAEEITGLVVDPQDPGHLWAGLAGGVLESRDGGRSWRDHGLAGKRVRWLAAAAQPYALYAGVFEDGIYRWESEAAGWTPASAGLPAGSTIIAFTNDPRSEGGRWCARDGGGLYRSADGGRTWTNVGAGMGDNLSLALAVNYAATDGLLAGTATAGVWSLAPGTQAAPNAHEVPSVQRAASVDARIEIVWPHGWAPVTEAKLANIGLRLFAPASLLPASCGWRPKVTLWRAVDTNPAEPLEQAEQRSVDRQPFPYWEVNDVDVSAANDPARKLYFLVRVDGVDTATSIWAHGADPRTYFPKQDVPSGIATGGADAVDARIQIVWPHDETGAERPVAEAPLANVAVTFFKHGTRLSVPVGWRPAGVTLFGSWNQETGRPLARSAAVQVRRAGAITYPVWEFNNIPVERAANLASDAGYGDTLYLWVVTDGVQTYPTVWAHGADSRTFFPAKDEPIQGCVP